MQPSRETRVYASHDAIAYVCKTGLHRANILLVAVLALSPI
jgi:hypothetical protein